MRFLTLLPHPPPPPLTTRQGKDPAATLLEAREARFHREAAAARERHARAMARLRDRFCAAAAAAAEGRAVDAARATDAQLLAWDGGGAGGAGGGEAGADSAAGGFAGSGPARGACWGQAAAGTTSGPQTLGARLAPLSGLVPPPLQSRLLPQTDCTPGEQLALR